MKLPPNLQIKKEGHWISRLISYLCIHKLISETHEDIIGNKWFTLKCKRCGMKITMKKIN